MKKFLVVAALSVAKIVAVALMAVVAIALTGYLFTPVYRFADPQPFAGEGVYNPYEGVDFAQARKAILHFHTNRSDGRDEPAAIVAAYRERGYEIVSPADHDRQTPAGDVPTAQELGGYEHGLNAYRFHNLVLGAYDTDPFQLPLWQGASGRENTLRRLSEKYDIVVLNHPGTVRAMSPAQIERLSGYDYIEADRAMDREVPLWDVGLSAGHYSYVMAGDDLHDLARPYAIGRAMTFVVTPTLDGVDVLRAIERGHTYAMRVSEAGSLPDAPELPRVEAFEVSGDTIRVSLTAPATVRFIGQGGAVRGEDDGATEAAYIFTDDDTYVRAEARFAEATIYLNPVARYEPAANGTLDADDEKPLNATLSTVDGTLTALSIAAHALLMLLLLWGIYRTVRSMFR
jgi:hypothetical protein